jgi:murein L,D-transpeptidase YafK
MGEFRVGRMGFQPSPAATIRRLAAIAIAAFCLASCQDSGVPKELKPVPHQLVAEMERLGMKETSKIFIRLFKESSELEIWKERVDGTFALLKTYSICKWSGELGPKKKEGDRQAPEGIYIVTPGQMNPNSSYYLSFNIGYPNAFDRSLGRTGSNLMVHGACSSAGCYSMTDEDAGEIFALARDSFRGGQTSFQIQALPFRMTAENLARHRDNSNIPFWRMLKVGSDTFELTRRPPKVDVCDRRYVFNATSENGSFDATAACPDYTVSEALTAALAKKQAEDDAALAVAVASLNEAETKAATDAAKAAEKQAADLAEKDAKAVEAEAKAAERAAKPSLMSRLIDRLTNRDEPAATPKPVAAAPVNAPPAAPLALSEPAKDVAAVPVPRIRPQVTPKPVSAEPQPQPVTGSTAATAGEKPAVGTFVKKKFLWVEDDAKDGKPL